MNGNRVARLQIPRSARRLAVLGLAILASCASSSTQRWTEVREGVDYTHFVDAAGSWHVTRIDLDQQDIVIFSSAEGDRGRTVSDFAERHDAIAAVNADYFDEDLAPIGPARGYCGDWEVRAAPVSRKQPVFVAGPGRAAIIDSHEPIPDWAGAAVSGWPRVVDACRAIPSDELPGSDFFTRAPHVRTAVGLSGDERTVYFVVADRFEGGEIGVTLPVLGTFMRETLGVCEALNLDGGGSSAMTIDQRLVSRTKSGVERNVANHLGVADRATAPQCENAAAGSREALQAIATRLGLEAEAGDSGVRVRLPFDEGSILLDHVGGEVMMSGSLVASPTVANVMKAGLAGPLRVSWTTPLDDGRERVQLGGRAPLAAVEGELSKLLSHASR